MENDSKSSLSSPELHQDSPGPPQPSKHLNLALNDLRFHCEAIIYNSLKAYKHTLSKLPELKEYALTWMDIHERLESEVTLLLGTHIKIGDDQVEGNKFTITLCKSSKEIPELNVQIISGMILRKILVDMAGEQHQNSKVFIDLSKKILTFIETNLGNSEAAIDIRITNPELTSAVVLSSAFEGTDSDGSQNEDETKKEKITVENRENKTEGISDREVSSDSHLQDKEENISDGEKGGLNDGQKSENPAYSEDRQDDETSVESSPESDSICSGSSSQLEKEPEAVKIISTLSSSSTHNRSSTISLASEEDITELENDPGLAK